MDVTTRTRQLRARLETTRTKANIGDPRLIEYDAVLQFMPSDPRLKAKVCAKFSQFVGLDGCHTLLPVLSTYMIVPKGSQIFIHASTGNLEGMKKLIQQRKASLRDCDPEGRSLVTYACYAEQPEICAFLLQHGADFDSIEPTFENASESLPPLGQFSRIRFPVLSYPLTWPDDCEARALCKNMLLASGADPLAKEQTKGVCPLQIALQEETETTIDQMLRISRIPLNLDQHLDQGRNPLLQHAYSYDGSNPQAISVLLEHGAKVNVTDDRGNTCLHFHVQSLLRISPETSRGLDALVLLFRAGADPYITNKDGLTASELAYAHTEDDVDLELGSYRADVWDGALRLCNLNPAAYGVPMERTYRYTRQYTEYHRLALYHGESYDVTHHDYWVFQALIYQHDSDGRIARHHERRYSEVETEYPSDIEEGSEQHQRDGGWVVSGFDAIENTPVWGVIADALSHDDPWLSQSEVPV